MDSQFLKLNKQLKRTWPQSDLAVVKRAFRYAREAHKDQKRNSGDPYVDHTLKVATILAILGLDPVTCAAGLLHDVLEDTPVSYKTLKEEFGEEIATLVDGVTKISNLSLAGSELVTREAKQAQNIRKMLVATAKDVRVILIKLADRVHNMRTIEHLPRQKQLRIARETLDIYAPLAHRLGISRWKWELEDHSFHVLHPEEYRELARLVAMKRRDREAHLEQTIAVLNEKLADEDIPAMVIGRPKHLYSIYSKMVRDGKDFSEVQDVLGLRVITKTEQGCYNALGVIHSIWTPIPGRLKDYIAMPKLNMYKSIHTTLMREDGRPMEVQIRSEEMDRMAREGVAAHWVYKEGDKQQDKMLDQQLKWLRQMYEWIKDEQAPEELLDSMRQDFKNSHTYVFTPKGEVKELPVGATPLDFAYIVHSDVGHHCMGARVNGRMVPLRYHLQTGDVVEIITSKNQTPHLDWVDVVVTGRARTRIRQRLRELGMLDPVDDPLAKAREQEREKEGTKKSTSASVKPVALSPVRDVDDRTRQSLIRIDGKKGISAVFAKCCNPMPGHAIIGYITKAPGITVHRADCKSFSKSARDPMRVVQAAWEGEESFNMAMRVVIGPRPNVLADITSALRPMNVDILRAHYGPGENGKSHFDFVFETHDPSAADRVMRTLRTVTGVTEVSPRSVERDDTTQVAQAS